MRIGPIGERWRWTSPLLCAGLLVLLQAPMVGALIGGRSSVHPGSGERVLRRGKEYFLAPPEVWRFREASGEVAVVGLVLVFGAVLAEALRRLFWPPVPGHRANCVSRVCNAVSLIWILMTFCVFIGSFVFRGILDNLLGIRALP